MLTAMHTARFCTGMVADPYFELDKGATYPKVTSDVCLSLTLQGLQAALGPAPSCTNVRQCVMVLTFTLPQVW